MVAILKLLSFVLLSFGLLCIAKFCIAEFCLSIQSLITTGMRCFCAQAQKQVEKCEIYLEISSFILHFVHISMGQIVNNFIIFFSENQHFIFFTENRSYFILFKNKKVNVVFMV